LLLHLAPNANEHLSAALLCYFRCNWFQNLAAVSTAYCIG